jgi:hypothetical protein
MDMEIVAAVASALVGAIISIAVSEVYHGLQERRRVLAAVASELRLNLESASQVLATNRKYIEHPPRKGDWWEILPFSSSSWEAAVSTGTLRAITPAMAQALSAAYALSRRAEFLATKLQVGRFDTREAREYTIRVNEAGDAMSKALAAVLASPRYRRSVGSRDLVDASREEWRVKRHGVPPRHEAAHYGEKS